MAESMGPEIFGYSLEVLLMLASGIFYLVCSYYVWKTYKREKNELIGALLAFLVYQSLNMLLMGLEVHTMNMVYGNLAALSVFIGSAYMLKFPFSSFSMKTRNMVFLLTLMVALGIFAWFMQSEARQSLLMHFVLWYDIIINGVIVGGFMILLSLKTTERYLRIKAMGGGTGVVSCCVVSSGAMLYGALFTSAFFGFLAPIVILGSLVVAKKSQIQNI